MERLRTLVVLEEGANDLASDDEPDCVADETDIFDNDGTFDFLYSLKRKEA